MSEIITGDALQTLRTLPSESVQCIVTSPPYFALRDYGVVGQIGLEESPAVYIAKLVDVFREARRVLRSDGTCWINLGDSYANDTKWGGSTGGKHVQALHGDNATRNRRSTGLAPKNLMMIPARVAIALQDDGWILRSDIIWNKLTAMPESVTDRCTSSHEHVFMLAKSERYYFDAVGIREPGQEWKGSAGTFARSDSKMTRLEVPGQSYASHRERDDRVPSGRNKRDVWSVSSGSGFKDAHFATFPPKLIEPMILAGTSPRACESCGAPWTRQVEHTQMVISHGPKAGGYGSRTTDGLSGTMLAPAETRTIGWLVGCNCSDQGYGRCIVLDPFCGAGTVPMVALRLNRQYLGIELNPEYVALINRRIAEVQPVLWEAAV